MLSQHLARNRCTDTSLQDVALFNPLGVAYHDLLSRTMDCTLQHGQTSDKTSMFTLSELLSPFIDLALDQSFHTRCCCFVLLLRMLLIRAAPPGLWLWALDPHTCNYYCWLLLLCMHVEEAHPHKSCSAQCDPALYRPASGVQPSAKTLSVNTLAVFLSLCLFACFVFWILLPSS